MRRTVSRVQGVPPRLVVNLPLVWPWTRPRQAKAAAELQDFLAEVHVRPSVDLDRAVLCINCEVIYPAGGGCPRCASRVARPMAPWVNRTAVVVAP